MGDCNDFEDHGFVWVRNALTQTQINTLRNLIPKSDKAGIRLNELTAVTNELNKSNDFRNTLQAILPKAFPVRGLAFNKTIDATWSLPWHQDRVIAVEEKYDIEGFTNWTRKAGVWHCEPPSNVLENMVFIQILLDDIRSSNGPMGIAIGSHKKGYVSQHEIDHYPPTNEVQQMTGKAGDIFCAKALSLHRSITATENSSRRTLRLDFANQALPSPLSYYH